ncbi:MAG: hypothetical protein N0C84_01385 [Candidatus Thiodiazotropha taylori]|uniref:Uncharacterized protein n=1 Tax=Candidatus Thiodiazotropha taylori TaxID=2792791 RepID=A0A9E4N398_9GAMM|nr:hypothetical protein [Candidatus Thiodiazotropha taylori]MCW4255100.1 hypothetical protein [Candidatus Thiodiazotropha taylori]
MAANIIDTMIIFRILKKLTTPWEKTKAFQTGVIDKKGKILVKPRDRTSEQKKAYTILDRLVFNLKRLLAKAPGGSTQLASYISALALIKEHVENEYNKETSQVLMERLEEQNIVKNAFKEHDISTPEGFMDAFEEAMMQEMTVSGASFGGAMSGAGDNNTINNTGRAGFDPVLGKKKKKVAEKILNRRI